MSDEPIATRRMTVTRIEAGLEVISFSDAWGRRYIDTEVTLENRRDSATLVLPVDAVRVGDMLEVEFRLVPKLAEL